MTLWVGSGPSDPLLGYFWHRLAVQAEIGQNRSIFPKWTNQPVTLGTNGLTEPAGFLRHGGANQAEDVQEDACHCARTAHQIALVLGHAQRKV